MKFKKILKNILQHTGYKIVNNKSDNKISKIAESSKIKSQLNGNAVHPFNQVPFAGETLEYVIKNHQFESVLDVGSGEGMHSDIFIQYDKRVTSIDFGNSVYFQKRSNNHNTILADYYEYNFDEKFDAVWASHVLEHQPNPNLFLKKIHSDLKEGGVLAITVPPLKHEIVGGHVTLWNAGLLIYQLVMAGFNCKNASVKSYGYNISVVLRKESILKYPKLSYDSGDIKLLSSFFPDNLSEPFDGRISELNWL